VDAICPIDKTPLVVDQEYTGLRTGYECRACKTEYYSLDAAENKEHAQGIVDHLAAERADAQKTLLYLEKLIAAAEKNGIVPKISEEQPRAPKP